MRRWSLQCIPLLLWKDMQQGWPSHQNPAYKLTGLQWRAWPEWQAAASRWRRGWAASAAAADWPRASSTFSSRPVYADQMYSRWSARGATSQFSAAAAAHSANAPRCSRAKPGVRSWVAVDKDGGAAGAHHAAGSAGCSTC